MILGVEIYYVVRPMAGDVVRENLVNQLPVRIDDRDSVAGGDISGEHVSEQRALAGTRTAEYCQMAAACGGHDVNGPAVVVGMFAAANEDGIKVHGGSPEIIRCASGASRVAFL
jgi:hypothetical protein